MMCVEMKVIDGIPVISLKGRIDFKNSGKVTEKMDKAADEGSQLAVDCTHLEYISSSGLRSILLLMKKMSKIGGKLAFWGINPDIMQVLEMTGIKDLMIICNNQDEAKAKITGE